MNLSNEIAGVLLELMEDSGFCEIKRNDLAERLGCVPSQINYVISSRFTPENGYTVESRRGGGGYVKITRMRFSDGKSLIMHLINGVGASADENECRVNLNNLLSRGALSAQQSKLIACAVSDKTLRIPDARLRDAVRASIFKNMLATIACDGGSYVVSEL